MDTFVTKIYETQSFQAWLNTIRNQINQVLRLNLEKYASVSPTLHSAMKYSLSNGGKRIRAAMIYSLASEFSLLPKIVDGIAASVETVHASSLIHDDLPALDNDDLRRGKPTCHIAFNEAIAILAGDALLNMSQQILLDIDELSDSQKVKLCKRLTHAIGSQGMIGGQSLEFQDDARHLESEKLKQLYNLKTGCLLGVGLQMLLDLTALSREKKALFAEFSNKLGLAFQIYDDILDLEASTQMLGKPRHSDKYAKKVTLVDSIGLDNAKLLLNELQGQAKNALDASGYSLRQLHAITDYSIKRKY